MKAHLVQMDMAWEYARENRERAAAMIDRAGPARGDLVLLPEMFDTGFSMNTSRTADTRGETLEFMIELAKDYGVVVQGGRTIKRCDQCLAANVMSVVSEEGALLCEYQKVHPFSLGKEHEHFAPGESVMTYRWGELTVAPAICYDLRFPELFRKGMRQGAEVFALGACWPKTRQHHWRALLIARAIENQAYVLGVNRVGRDPSGPTGAGLEYVGGSMVVSPTGEVLGELGAEAGVLSVEVEAGEVKRWREKFPAIRDARMVV